MVKKKLKSVVSGHKLYKPLDMNKHLLINKFKLIFLS